MIKDKSRLAIKLFIIVWIVLAVHITLKLTFNYWQPYVIPNEQLQYISDFIDSHTIIKTILNLIFYVFNGYVMICCSLQVWNLRKKYNIITLILLVIGFFFGILIDRTIMTLLLSIVYPLILNKKKLLTILLTFGLSFVFLSLSLWLEGFVSSNNMSYIVATFLNIDYYIMLILNYFVFNLIKKEKVK